MMQHPKKVEEVGFKKNTRVTFYLLLVIISKYK